MQGSVSALLHAAQDRSHQRQVLRLKYHSGYFRPTRTYLNPVNLELFFVLNAKAGLDKLQDNWGRDEPRERSQNHENQRIAKDGTLGVK